MGNAAARGKEGGSSGATMAGSRTSADSSSGGTGQWFAGTGAEARATIGQGLAHVPVALDWASGPGFRLMFLASGLLVAFLLWGQQAFVVVRILGWEIVGAGPDSLNQCPVLHNCSQVRRA